MTNKETTFSWDVDEVSLSHVSGAVNICQKMTGLMDMCDMLWKKGETVTDN